MAGPTSRQAEVPELIAEGLTNPEIADRLFVSPRTVEPYVSANLAKLDVTTRQGRQQGPEPPPVRGLTDRSPRQAGPVPWSSGRPRSHEPTHLAGCGISGWATHVPNAAIFVLLGTGHR